MAYCGIGPPASPSVSYGPEETPSLSLSPSLHDTNVNPGLETVMSLAQGYAALFEVDELVAAAAGIALSVDSTDQRDLRSARNFVGVSIGWT